MDAYWQQESQYNFSIDSRPKLRLMIVRMAEHFVHLRCMEDISVGVLVDKLSPLLFWEGLDNIYLCH